MGVAGGPNTSESGLVLCLDAGNPRSYRSGSTTWFDLSGNGYTGSLTNGPGFSSTNGGSITFDGTNDYVDIPDATPLNPTTITISSWVYLSSLVTNQNIVSKGYTSVALPYISYTLKMNDVSPFNNVQIGASIGGTGYNLTSSISLTTATWYNVAGTYDGTTFKLYVNGVQDINTLTATGSITSYATPVQIGRWGTQASQYLNGRVALAQIYNRALSAQEIKQNYDALKTRFQ